MIAIECGDDCFIRLGSRVYRGEAVRVFERERMVQVRTNAAGVFFKAWTNLTFRLWDGRGDAAREAMLIVPETLAEWSGLGEEADNAKTEPVKAMASVAPRPVVSKPAPVAAWMPYKDDEREESQPCLPEGYEEGEKLP